MFGKVFVIGDTHFGHENIIRYCNRPFSSIKEMDSRLLDNWNDVVDDNDVVYFLGDLCKRDHVSWMRSLSGGKIFVKGNHDSFPAPESVVIEYDGIRFLLVHDPEGVVFDGWIIHAHKHNNDLVNYPFFNAKDKRINVSVEVIGYRPMPLDDIVKKIRGV